MTAKQPPTGRMETMSEELEQLLKNLKLRRILEIYDEQLPPTRMTSATRSS